MNPSEHCPDSSAAAAQPGARPKRRLRNALLGTALLAALLAWVFREPLRSRITEEGILANDSPPSELVEDMIERAADPQAAVLAAWNSGKTVHRLAAVSEVRRVIPQSEPLPAEIESMVLTGSLDPDMDVREVALGILRDRNHPALAALAAAQLRDLDPQVRLLGLDYLKRLNASIGVPTVVPLLDDSDPLIVTMGLKLLEHWTGQQFGVKLSETAPIENEKTGLKEFREGSQAKAKAGAERAKAWWKPHQAQFAPVHLEVPAAALAAQRPVAALDFQLPTLAGRKLRLSDLRGKVVLLNFWTTWCTACVSEMPELIALQKRQGDHLAIVGVSLDFVPDEHGHLGGYAAVEEQNHAEGEHDDHEHDKAALKKVREKVARTVKARGINYTILLDEKNEVGGRYNGGELPTTVIIDAEGHVRRRFVGARSLPVFEAMIAEASQPRHLAANAAKAPGIR